MGRIEANVFRVHGERDGKAASGSAFAVHVTKDATYLLTACHVVRDVGSEVLVEGRPAEVVAKGSPDRLDLAVLEVKARLSENPLSISGGEKPGDAIEIYGFGKGSGDSARARSLPGKLGSATQLSWDDVEHRVPAWDLHIDGEDDEFLKLLAGYSGAPVCDAENRVVGVVTHQVGREKERGYAISIDAFLYGSIDWKEDADAGRWLTGALAERFEACLLHAPADAERALGYERSLGAEGVRVWPPDHGPLCAPPVESMPRIVVMSGREGLAALDSSSLEAAFKHPDRLVKAVLEPEAAAGSEGENRGHEIDHFRNSPVVDLSEASPEEGGFASLLVAIRGASTKSDRAPALDPPPLLADLLERVERRGLTLFVGPALANAYAGDPSSPSPLVTDLLERLELPPPAEGMFPPLDYIGMLYLVRHGRTGLDEDVSELLRGRYEGLDAALPDAYRKLAEVIRRLKKIKDDSPQMPSMLVVTTNLDLMIEVALVCEGIPFSQLVYHASDGEFRVTEVSLGEVERIRKDGTARLVDVAEEIKTLPDRRIALREQRQAENLEIGLDTFVQPVLFKYHGSDGVDESSVIATHEFYITEYWSSPLPDDLTETITNTNCVFLGYRMLDATFQRLYQSLLSDLFKRSKVRLFVLPAPRADDPYENAEHVAAGQRDVRGRLAIREVDTVEYDSANFLDDMSNQLGAR